MTTITKQLAEILELATKCAEYIVQKTEGMDRRRQEELNDDDDDDDRPMGVSKLSSLLLLNVRQQQCVCVYWLNSHSFIHSLTECVC